MFRGNTGTETVVSAVGDQGYEVVRVRGLGLTSDE